MKKATLTARRGTMGPVMNVRLATERKTTYYLTVRGVVDCGASAGTVTSTAITALFHRAIARNQKAVLAEQWDPRFELSLSRDHPPRLPHLATAPLDYASKKRLLLLLFNDNNDRKTIIQKTDKMKDFTYIREREFAIDRRCVNFFIYFILVLFLEKNRSGRGGRKERIVIQN